MIFLRAAVPLFLLMLLPGISMAEEPLQTSLCEITKDPAAYDHKLVRVSGTVFRGFEGFVIRDRSCREKSADIWLELGGLRGSEVTYCCGVTTNPKRESPLVIEGMETTLIQDKTFKRFQRITRGDGPVKTAKVTVVGRFFAGHKHTFPGGTFWVGYGHMSFYSLLVIQQVVTVDKR
jgi:hypothetical protein